MIEPTVFNWLLEHDAVVHFGLGRKIGIDFSSRRDGLRLQVSAWTFDDAIAEAKRIEARRALDNARQEPREKDDA